MTHLGQISTDFYGWFLDNHLSRSDIPVLYGIVFINLDSASHSEYQSESIPVCVCVCVCVRRCVCVLCVCVCVCV